MSNTKLEQSNMTKKTFPGINLSDSEVLEPEATRPGGLVRPDKGRLSAQSTPRGSLLGLDRLAKEKREEVAENGSRKRPRVEDRTGFKGQLQRVCDHFRFAQSGASPEFTPLEG